MTLQGVDGIIERRPDGGATVKFDRLIDRPVETIWAALTDPKVLANWIGRVEVELLVGGKYVVHFRDSKNVMRGTITRLEPLRLLEYTWLESHISSVPQSLVRWELQSKRSGCRLRLTHSVPPAPWKEIVGYAGGWQDFLEKIPCASDGKFVPYDHENYEGLDKLYRAKFAHLENTQ